MSSSDAAQPRLSAAGNPENARLAALMPGMSAEVRTSVASARSALSADSRGGGGESAGRPLHAPAIVTVKQSSTHKARAPVVRFVLEIIVLRPPSGLRTGSRPVARKERWCGANAGDGRVVQ